MMFTKKNKVLFIRTSDMEVEFEAPVGRYPTRLRTSIDGKTVFVLNSVDNTATLVDAEKRTTIDEFFVGKCPTSIALHPKNSAMYIVNRNDWEKSVSIFGGPLEEL